MPKLAIYNAQGKTDQTVDLPDDIFGVSPRHAVIRQVFQALEANRREPWADTKNKSEVRGGGRKPWRQKGTGRARHGSIRSPLWKGGGVTFGPISARNYKQKINKKMNALALKMCLSDKVSSETLLVVDTFPADGKAKTMQALRDALPGKAKTMLVLATESNLPIGRALRNLPNTDMQRAVDLNAADLLVHQYILVTPEGIDILKQRLGRKQQTEIAK